MNPRGFFCLSSVRDGLRNVAWPRLGVRRSGGGKARKQSLHSGALFPGRCQARCSSHAFRKGMNGPQLPFSASWGRTTPAPFDATPVGTLPHGRRLFLALWFETLYFLKPWIGYPCLHSVEIANTLVQRGNVFTPGPSPCNPYVILFSRYCVPILTRACETGNARAKATHASPLPLKWHGLRRAKAHHVIATGTRRGMSEEETKKRKRQRTPNNRTTTGYRISDELWAVLQPRLSVHANTHRFGGGRPSVPDRRCADAIFYVLRTGWACASPRPDRVMRAFDCA
jgi:hypothetical protein